MSPEVQGLALQAFQRAAARVPAYRTLLAEARVDPASIKGPAEFSRLPVLEKRDTFQRFPVAELCVDGRLGQLGSVLTSSGHSGIFAFGLTASDASRFAAGAIDDILDALFQVRSRPTLLINSLPMGVKVATEVCTLAETSVRPDMVVGLVKAFGQHYAQIVIVGEAAFIKHTLELGRRGGVDWPSYRIQVIVGEEPLAENARKYIESLLGLDVRQPERGLVASSMGVAELGLNLFFEAPPVAPLILLRRVLHENAELRHRVLGAADWVPSLFLHDPRRLYVEFDREGRLILSTLDPHVTIPLIRYATGDRGGFLRLPPETRPALEAAGVPWEVLQSLPIAIIHGRGDHALAGKTPVSPEAAKEGIYHDPALAELTTANFRLVAGPERVRVRIQLSPGVAASPELEQRFAQALARYIRAPFEVACESYESFGSGMTLDYERKFQYLGP